MSAVEATQARAPIWFPPQAWGHHLMPVRFASPNDHAFAVVPMAHTSGVIPPPMTHNMVSYETLDEAGRAIGWHYRQTEHSIPGWEPIGDDFGQYTMFVGWLDEAPEGSLFVGLSESELNLVRTAAEEAFAALAPGAERIGGVEGDVGLPVLPVGHFPVVVGGTKWSGTVAVVGRAQTRGVMAPLIVSDLLEFRDPNDAVAEMARHMPACCPWIGFADSEFDGFVRYSGIMSELNDDDVRPLTQEEFAVVRDLVLAEAERQYGGLGSQFHGPPLPPAR